MQAARLEKKNLSRNLINFADTVPTKEVLMNVPSEDYFERRN